MGTPFFEYYPWTDKDNPNRFSKMDRIAALGRDWANHYQPDAAQRAFGERISGNVMRPLMKGYRIDPRSKLIFKKPKFNYRPVGRPFSAPRNVPFGADVQSSVQASRRQPHGLNGPPIGMNGASFFGDVGNFFTKTIPSAAKNVGSTLKTAFGHAGDILQTAGRYIPIAGAPLSTLGSLYKGEVPGLMDAIGTYGLYKQNFPGKGKGWRKRGGTWIDEKGRIRHGSPGLLGSTGGRNYLPLPQGGNYLKPFTPYRPPRKGGIVSQRHQDLQTGKLTRQQFDELQKWSPIRGSGLTYPSVYQRRTGFLINPDGTPREGMLYPTNHPGAQGWRADWKGGVTDWPTAESRVRDPPIQGFATIN